MKPSCVMPRKVDNQDCVLANTTDQHDHTHHAKRAEDPLQLSREEWLPHDPIAHFPDLFSI
jgi:hypothetical protein